MDPQKHHVLLVGPRVVHLKPFFERRRYQVAAVQKGVEGMSALDAEPRDIVILELNLGDLTATEFLMAARQAHAQASFLLLDDASKAGLIVKALQAGLDGYLPTPPDEDRLFFEVERHLRHAPPPGARASASSSGAGDGFETRTGETQVSLRGVEHTELQTQLADRESQLLEIGVQHEMLRQEVGRLRDESRALADIRQALLGVVDGALDREQAGRIKERLAMLTVLETEVDALREELAGTRQVRRELQEQIEQLKRKVQALEAARDERDEQERRRGAESLEGPALKEKASELEADNMVLAGRLGELEEDLARAKADLAARDERRAASEARATELEGQLEILRSEQALKASDIEELGVTHAAAVARLDDEKQAAVARLRAEHEPAIERLTFAAAEAAAEKAALETRLEEALRARRDDRLAAEREAGREAGREAELQAQLEAAQLEKDQAIGRALDVELVLDELKAKIEELEREVQRQQERARSAESSFKKDKLRLIEAKEQAAAGSQEAFAKVQRFIDENAALKRHNAELEARCAALEERARREDDTAERDDLDLQQATLGRAEALQERDAAEGARRMLEEKLAAVERHLGAQITSLERRLEDAQRRVHGAEAALADAGTVARDLAEARAAREQAEGEATRLGEKLAGVELALAQARAAAERSHEDAGGDAELAAGLRARVQTLEAKLAAEETAAAEARAHAAALEEQALAQRDAIVEEYEERLRQALLDQPLPPADIVAERDAYRRRLAETDAWVQQAQLHLEALRVERDQLAAQATALGHDLQTRGGEAHALVAELTAARHHIESLTGRTASLEQELVLARQQLHQRSSVGPDPQAFAQAQDEIRHLRAQLQEVLARAGASGRLPEELEPLRWTLTAAIDALTALEVREPSLGAHLRNLRLLATTLQRLSPSA